MSSMAAVNESEPQAVGDGEPTRTSAPSTARPPATLDPQLLMAARRGDTKQLKDLLLLKDDDDEHQGTSDGSGSALSATTAAAAGAQDVIVEVDPRPPHDAVALAPVSPPSSPSGSSSLRVPLLDEDGVTMEGDSLVHVVAACGDSDEYLDCAKMIVHDKKHKGGAAGVRLALEARNHKGDTPLHCAAGAGNANMITCLIGLIAYTTDYEEEAAAKKKTFLRVQNECGETTLHQAIRAANNKVACIDQLMDVDPELACIPCDDEDGASPLYLAISLGEVEIAQHLYSKSNGKLSYTGPHGRNVLHAAVHRGQALRMILKWLIKDTEPEEDGPAKCPANGNKQGEQHMMRGKSSSVSLVSRLTNQRDRNQTGSTPLHLAASLNGWRHAWLLSRWFPQVWPTAESMATLLLDANESTAYQADDEGLYPIHVAAWCGSLRVVKLLLGRCPGCATLRDAKGRTFLHVATEEGRHCMVEYVCGEMPQQLSLMILNAQDKNGDTALHGAVRAGDVAVFTCLLRNRRVRLDVVNKDGMTPLDLSYTMVPSGMSYQLHPSKVLVLSLVYSGAPYAGSRVDLFCEKHRKERNLVEDSKKYTEATQVTSIVSALIATVTFASAFTLPGGYTAAGTPVLAGKSYAFDAFILADTLACIFSMLATCTLVYVGSPALDNSARCNYFNISALLLQSAARSLVAAFGLALYLVLAPVDHKTAVAVCAIVFATSLYGNMGARQIARVANTARIRIGMRRFVVCVLATIISFGALVNFGSYIIIFGLPAILKLAR